MWTRCRLISRIAFFIRSKSRRFFVVVLLVLVDNLHRLCDHPLEMAAVESSAFSKHSGSTPFRYQHRRFVYRRTRVGISSAEFCEFFFLWQLEGVLRGDGTAQEILESVGHEHVMIEFLGHLLQQIVITVSVNLFVDPRKERNQLA